MTVSAGAGGRVPTTRSPSTAGRCASRGSPRPTCSTTPSGSRRRSLRGSDGRFAPASWETALDFIAERLLAIRAAHGPEALAAFGSGALTNEKAYLLGKFARLALRTPHIDYNGRYCMSSAAAGQNRAFGIDRGLPFPVSDIAETKTLLLWGSNCADTMPPHHAVDLRAARPRGALIVVDPRRTDTARGRRAAPPAHAGDRPRAGQRPAAPGHRRRPASIATYIAARTVGFDERPAGCPRASTRPTSSG